MTMGPVEIERKVRQLDNDVQSIYTMLSAIQGTQERHTNRLGELAVKVDGLDGKVDALAGRVASLDTKVDTVLDLLQAGPAGHS
jgi:outer membrane murein-binding lipoprotein Lpp